MFVNWVAFLFNEIWKQEISKMEGKDGRCGKIPFYVDNDNGAFYLFEDGYCTDLEPN